MLEFRVEDMSCGHCAGSITKAVTQADPQARVEVDLASKTVRIEGASNAAKIEEAISEAGFTPVKQQ